MTAIVDFEDALHLAQKALQCSICLEMMTDPVLTKCGHRFCSHCMSKLLRTTKDSVPAVCPLCKQPVSKRSLAKQSKFENILKVMEDLADAFQEDLMNPTNADWCADTLEQDTLSQGILDAVCLDSMLDVEHSLVPASVHGAPARQTDGGDGGAAIAATLADGDGGRSGSSGGSSSADRVARRGRLGGFDSQGLTDGAPLAVDASSSARPALTACNGGGDSDDAGQRQRTGRRQRVAAPVALAEALADGAAGDAPLQPSCPVGDCGWPLLERVKALPPPPPSPLSVNSSSSDDDSPLVVAEQSAAAAGGDVTTVRVCDSPELDDRVESSVAVVGCEDSRAAVVAPGGASASASASAAAAAAAHLPTSSHAVDRSWPAASSRRGTASSLGAGAATETVRGRHQIRPPVEDRDSDMLSSADEAFNPKEHELSAAATSDTHENACADVDIGDDASFEETLITESHVSSAAVAPLVMTGCSLSLQDVEEAQRLARLHSGRYQPAFTSSVTHVLVRAGDAEAHSADELPAKVYLGIASRCRIVKVSWIYDSLQAGRLLPEESYNFGSTLPHEYCIDRAAVQLPGPAAATPTAISPTSATPGVLAAWEVCCSTRCQLLSPDDLHDLVRLCGARMIRDPASFSFLPETSRVILVDKKGSKKETLQASARLGRLYASPVADYKWLLVCIVYRRLFVPHKRCIDCYVPGCDDLWNRVNVPALFSRPPMLNE